MNPSLKKLFFLPVFTLFLSPTGAQVLDKLKVKDLKTAREKVKNLKVNDVVDIAKDQYIVYLKKHKDDFDKTDLNYAVSFSDNSGMYETEEKFGRMQKTLLYVMDPTALEDRSVKDRAADYNDAGEMFYATGRYTMAEKSFEAARLAYLSLAMQDSTQYSKVISNLGLLCHTMGRFNLAEQYTLEALQKRQLNPEDKKGLAASLNNLAVLYKDQGKYSESDETIMQAQQLARESEGPKSTAYAITLNNQAILYQLTGKYEDAERILKQALAVAGEELGKRSPNYIRMKINLALLYQLEGRYPQAETIFLDAIEIKKRRFGTSHPDYAVLLQNLASLYQLEQKYDKVEANLKQALDIYKNKFGEQHPSVASALYDLARFYQFQNKTDQALPLLKRALQIQLDNLGEHHPSYASSMEALAILYWQQGNIQSAMEKYRQVMDEYLYQVRVYFPSMSEYDKTRFWDQIGPRFLRFNAFALDAYSQFPEITGDMYNNRIATKAILLSSTSKVKKRILESSDETLKKKYADWLDLKEYISRLYSKSREELRNENINLDSLEQVSNLMEKDLGKMSETFSGGYESKLTNWKEIATALSATEAGIEIIRFRNYKGPKTDTAIYYAGLIIRNNSKYPQLVVLRNGNELEEQVIGGYRSAMQDAAVEAPYYESFWGEIGNNTSGVTDLYASLDGIYNQINLNTLQKKDGKFLIDEKNIWYVSNTKEILDLKKARAGQQNPFGSKTAVLIGNPHYAKDLSMNDVKSSPLPELPGTAVEMQKIEQQLKPLAWKISAYKYDDATETNLRKIKQPAILHIATHGFFLEDLPESEEKVFGIEPVKASRNPLLRSGLMFAGADNTIQQIGKQNGDGRDDGILNAYEAMMLDLDNSQLVVLSACETGLGETKNGEGVYGLQRAFEIAGAKGLIISLWEVSDEVTQQLMTSFYKNWLSLKDKHKAFTRAQLEIKTKHPEPFYWGAFVMLGN
ncbi:MAG: CHAT domain-containing tetratricopeptide repeat protein [Bacteroidales bacterium]